MFEFVKQIFISAMMFFGCNLSNVNPLKSISMNNRTRNKECKIRPKIVNVNSDEPTFYPYSVKTNKCSGSCNDPYAKMCIPGVVKKMNIKVFNLMSRTNETIYIKFKCRCKYRCVNVD